MLAYDAFPVCGDGVDFAVDFHPVHGKSRSLLKVRARSCLQWLLLLCTAAHVRTI